MSANDRSRKQNPDAAPAADLAAVPAEGEFVKHDAREGGVLYIGIDLGTSRTSIAASNGVRAMVESFVAYPRDVVARKMIGKEVLFGQEALKHRLSCDFYRPLEDGGIKYSTKDFDPADPRHQAVARATADLIRHALTLARPSPDQIVYAVIGAPAQAAVHNKQAVIEAARPVVDAVMITSEPFNVAYGVDRLADCLIVDIGAGTTDFCRMHGVMPAPDDQRTTTLAGDYVDRELMKLLQQKCPGAAFTVHGVKQIKEKFGASSRVADEVWVDFPVNGRPTRFEVSKELRQACNTIIPSMIENLFGLISSFDPDFQAHLRNNVILAGGGSQMIGLRQQLEAALQELGGGSVTAVDEPTYAGANGALKLAHDMPAEYWQQLS
ncbi:MAG: rod shape-determining protein [Planctomycetes bacterium]|nr:rod shape-determining protein [Planctomycetota bacterium]